MRPRCDALTRAVLDAAQRASWVVLSGSLPPGAPDDWYAEIVAMLAPLPCRVAVDTSDAPLAALAAGVRPRRARPHQTQRRGARRPVGASPEALEHAAAAGDPEPVVAAAQRLIDRGVRAVLVTLGAAGAVLVDRTGSWMATPPPITPRSTVGAGDSALAGYLRADVGGADRPTPPDGGRLRERGRGAAGFGAARRPRRSI